MKINFKRALIAGGSRGLGRQIAVKLAREGVKKIAIHYRRGKSEAEQTLSLVEAQGASGVLLQGDVADAQSAESVVKEAAQKLGGCDIFIHSVCPPLGEIYEHVMATELSLESGSSRLILRRARFSFVLGLRQSSCAVAGGLSVCPTLLVGGRVAGNPGWEWDRRRQRWKASAGISQWRWADLELR